MQSDGFYSHVYQPPINERTCRAEGEITAGGAAGGGLAVLAALSAACSGNTGRGASASWAGLKASTARSFPKGDTP